MLSSVPFGSFLVYSPRGTSPLSTQSQKVCYAIKADGPGPTPGGSMIEYAADALARQAPAELRDLLSPDATLVPVPRSAPFPPRERNVLWPPRLIAEALSARGFGAAVLPCLVRAVEVPRSSSSPRGQRPDPTRHYDSLRVERVLPVTGRVVLVDDVVTKGATFLGAASRLAEAWPDADVRCFALVRTLGFQPDIERLVEPVVGSVRRTRSGKPERLP